jgi:dienelactone hydrolase
MCHIWPTAPQPSSSVRQDQRRTTGADPVPYLVLEPEIDDTKGRGERPQVVIATDIYGINPFYRHLAALLAERITGPALGFWGRQDYIEPSEVGLLAAALEQAPGQHEVVWYERAGHSFLAGLTEDGHESAEAAADSWRRTLNFLHDHLGSMAAAR